VNLIRRPTGRASGQTVTVVKVGPVERGIRRLRSGSGKLARTWPHADALDS